MSCCLHLYISQICMFFLDCHYDCPTHCFIIFPFSFSFQDSPQLLNASGPTLPAQSQPQNSSHMHPLLDQPMSQATPSTPGTMHSGLQNTLQAQIQSSLESMQTSLQNPMQTSSQTALQASIQASIETCLPTPMQTNLQAQIQSSIQNQLQKQ